MKVVYTADVLFIGAVDMDKYTLHFWGPPLRTKYAANLNGDHWTELSAYHIFLFCAKRKPFEVEWVKELK